MHTTNPTETALLASIISHPDEHTPRLMYADALQENGDYDRAEFIRLQCQIALIRESCGCRVCVSLRGGGQHHNGVCACECRQDDGVPLGLRERELLATNRIAWLSAEPCPECGGAGSVPPHGFQLNTGCSACFGTGDVGGLLREFGYDGEMGALGHEIVTEPLRINWSRYPLLQLEVPELLHLENSFQFAQGSRSLPTPWLAAVVRHWPTVISCVSLDREPYRAAVPGALFYWRRDCANFPDPDHSTIPSPIFDHLECFDKNTIAMPYSTRASAVAALGRAVVAWARSQPLTE